MDVLPIGNECVAVADWKETRAPLLHALAHPWTVALSLPILFFLLGSAGKFTSRQETKIRDEDLYLGVDLCLAAFTNGIANSAELIRGMSVSGAVTTAKVEATIVLVMVSVGSVLLLLFFAYTQRLLDTEDYGTPRLRFWLLKIVANGVGALALVATIVIKGV